MAKIIIVLEIEGSNKDALYVVNETLDSGVLQDTINEHDFDAGPLKVTSATCEISE